MASQIALGGQIRIQVTRTPRSEAGRKTLLRLLMKDPDLRKRHAKNLAHRARAIQMRPRAGRKWAVIPRKALPVSAAPGEEATLLATADVLADLAKLEPYVDVAAV